MRRTRLFLLIVLFTAPALAQVEDGTYLLVSSNTVSPTRPITTIEVWATWTDPGLQFPFLFVSGDYGLTAGEGVFSNPVSVLRGTPGVIAGNVISGADIFQVHLPAIGLYGSRDNPILLATYDWTTTDFTPHAVSLDTSNTTNFLLLDLLPGGAGTTQLFPWWFTPGSGVINVVPAPAAWVVLALPLVAASRRRRC